MTLLMLRIKQITICTTNNLLSESRRTILTFEALAAKAISLIGMLSRLAQKTLDIFVGDNELLDALAATSIWDWVILLNLVGSRALLYGNLWGIERVSTKSFGQLLHMHDIWWIVADSHHGRQHALVCVLNGM